VIAGLAAIPIKLGFVPFFHPFVGAGSAAFWARVWSESPSTLLGLFLGTVVLLNVLLAVFNFLPLAPLDGFAVAVGLLPGQASETLQRLAPWGPGILMVLIMLPLFSSGQFDPLFSVLGPLVDFFLQLFVGGPSDVSVG
jgi:Zn-dependent protease